MCRSEICNILYGPIELKTVLSGIGLVTVDILYRTILANSRKCTYKDIYGMVLRKHFRIDTNNLQ